MGLKEFFIGNQEVQDARRKEKEISAIPKNRRSLSQGQELDKASMVMFSWRAMTGLKVAVVLGGAFLANHNLNSDEGDFYEPPEISEATYKAAVLEATTVLPQSFDVSIEVDESIVLPKSEVVDRPVIFQKPAHYEMSEDEYQMACRKAADDIQELITYQLEPALEKGGVNVNRLKQDFINEIGRILRYAHPEFKLHWDRNSDPSDPNSDMKKVNDLLHPAGFHLHALTDEHGNYYVNILPVERTEHVKVSDDKDEVEVPVIHLGKGIIEAKDYTRFSGSVGQSVNGNVYIYEEALGEAIDRMLRTRPEMPRFQDTPSRDEMIAEELRTTRHHEAVHELLLRRFPLAMGRQTTVFRRTIPVKVAGKTLPIKGNFTPRNYDEMAAFGSEFNISDSLSVFLHGLELSPPGKTVSNYLAFRTLIPFATLASAPDTEIKRELVEGILTENQIYWYKLLQLVGNEPYSLEDTREAGTLMYRMGYAHLEDIEQGLK